MTPTIDLNIQFKKALELMEKSRKHLFLTGKAGTGKSTLLDYFRRKTKKKCVVLAPTGVAAVNIKGETIHSFFHFMPNVTLREAKSIAQRMKKTKLYQELEMIIIDEVSMVRADLLDAVDQFLQTARQSPLPFGNIQMILIGDLYQLSPIVRNDEKQAFKSLYKTPWFFSSQVIEQLLKNNKKSQLEFIELEKIYRQTDESFIRLLNNIRNRSVTNEEIAELNQRYRQGTEDPENYIHLTALNKQADFINNKNLRQLATKSRTYTAQIQGKFKRNNYPTETELVLKPDARVMFLNNDSRHRWINGTMGTVLEIEKDKVNILLDNEKEVCVKPFSWTIYKTYFNKQARSLDKEIVGSFTQMPLRLAWAITIHKSQGKTFDKVVIDVGRGTFAHGQMYVALSRCQTLKGIIFKQPLKKSHILMDYQIIKFLTSFQYQKSEEKMSLQEKIDFLKKAAKNKQKLKITYLKAKDEKSTRTILPLKVKQMEYLEYYFIGLEAYCFLRKNNRIFRVDRILEIIPVSNC